MVSFLVIVLVGFMLWVKLMEFLFHWPHLWFWW